MKYDKIMISTYCTYVYIPYLIICFWHARAKVRGRAAHSQASGRIGLQAPGALPAGPSTFSIKISAPPRGGGRGGTRRSVDGKATRLGALRLMSYLTIMTCESLMDS